MDWFETFGKFVEPFTRPLGTAPIAPVPAPSAPLRLERLALALQGGGSFGAFTWGVLDRLLEDEGILIEAISGASAGAVNAVLLASGMLEGGRAVARGKLERFWRRLSRAASFSPNGGLSIEGFGMTAFSLAPHLFNPFNLNPLREALAAEVDFERLRRESPIKLLVGATRVRDGALRIFETGELTLEAVLASTCLPLLNHQIVIDGETYWDGAYSANPPLVPLALKCEAERLLIVQVTPNAAERPPTTPTEIAKRMEQIQFNATLNRELDALKCFQQLGATPKLARLKIDLIAAHDEIDDLAAENASNLGWSFLQRLNQSGRVAGGNWLAVKRAETGARSGL